MFLLLSSSVFCCILTSIAHNNVMLVDPNFYLLNNYSVIPAEDSVEDASTGRSEKAPNETNKTPATSLVSKFFSLIKRIFYENTLFFAFDNQAIMESLQKYKDLSWAQKFKLGVIKGIEKVVVALLIMESLRFALSGMKSGREATQERSSMPLRLAVAIVEEVLFRGVLQNCLAGLQKIVTKVSPQCLQNNRIFRWLTSPSARIIIINSLFAAAHLSNGGTYLSDKDSLIQSIRIMLQPSYGILHETTNNIIAPVACHMTNNFLAYFL